MTEVRFKLIDRRGLSNHAAWPQAQGGCWICVHREDCSSVRWPRDEWPEDGGEWIPLRGPFRDELAAAVWLHRIKDRLSGSTDPGIVLCMFASEASPLARWRCVR